MVSKLFGSEDPNRPVKLDRFPTMGGDFTLADTHGKTSRLSDRQGRVVLLFFGYTSCTDACPLTMSTAAHAMRLLGAQADGVDVLFITVDPARDTPERLQAWLTRFDPRFIGLREEGEALSRVEQHYAAFHGPMPSHDAKSHGLMHTSRFFLIDQQGDLRYLFTPDQSAEAVASGVRLLLEPVPWWMRVRNAFGG